MRTHRLFPCSPPPWPRPPSPAAAPHGPRTRRRRPSACRAPGRRTAPATTRADNAGLVPDYPRDALSKKLDAVRAGHTVTVDDDPWYLNAGPTAARVVLHDITEHLGG
ncbi:hypothetical protein [Streptomyces sp. NPDC021212]|uniref:hypothetical protein n=1 Tax=Streptomyces sp. NPDC021212 TaxID=3365118 RepID=UPI00379C58F9